MIRLLFALTLLLSGCSATQHSEYVAPAPTTQNETPLTAAYFDQLANRLSGQSFDPTPLFDAPSMAQYRSEIRPVAERQPEFFKRPWDQTHADAITHALTRFDSYQWYYLYQHSWANGRYLDSMFRLERDGQTNFIRLIWSTESHALLDMHSLFSEFSVVGALNEFDSIAEQDTLSEADRLKFMQIMGKLNDEKLDQAAQDFQTLPEQLQRSALFADRLSWLDLDRSASARAMLARNAELNPEPHPHFYTFYLQQQDFAAALRCLDALPAELHDEYWTQMEYAVAHYQLNHPKQANFAINNALLREPYLQAPYLLKLMIALRNQDWEGATLTLKVLQGRFDANFSSDDLKTLENGEQLIRSSDYLSSFG